MENRKRGEKEGQGQILEFALPAAILSGGSSGQPSEKVLAARENRQTGLLGIESVKVYEESFQIQGNTTVKE